ncbi:DNA polymerase III subunit delta [Thiofilum flexile]|uniref:DNA polymerase III subunit delta n=1 Tax=Thiofilum flexile TaxID=125627 RepID=UPI00037E7580|nr:DNA polymerase III subunit delta [Thiofilum flexile]
MQLAVEQVADHLARQLLPIYWVTGDEPLQVMETAELIQAKAREQGFIERQLLSVDAQFDWGQLTEAASALSLFAQRTLIDLRLYNAKLGQNGAKALQHYLQVLPSDKILLVQSERLDKSQRNAAWFKALDKAGVIVNVWELTPAKTQAWIAKRAQQAGLKASTEALRYLSERMEGNLLAAQQEIQKLKLLFGDQPIEVKQIASTVADNARYSVFDLSDAILQRDSSRLMHVFKILQAEDTALPLIIWALGDVMRQGYEVAHGSMPPAVTPMRREALQRARPHLQKLPWSVGFEALGRLEQHAKGVGMDAPRNTDRLWDEAITLALWCAGISISLMTTQ